MVCQFNRDCDTRKLLAEVPLRHRRFRLESSIGSMDESRAVPGRLLDLSGGEAREDFLGPGQTQPGGASRDHLQRGLR